MKFYTLLLYILTTAAFLLSASCNRKDARPLPEELVRAGRLVWDTPDSALYVLQSMPVPSESQRLARATWALLTAQARYKLFLPQTDSLIHIACSYFRRHGDARQKAYAYLYKAGISRELQREDEAQRFYQLAAEKVEQTDDARLGYLIYIGLSELYAYQDMGEHSLRMADKAAEYAGLCKDSAYICSAAMLRARAYTVLDSLRMAACCYKESLRFANNPIDMSDVSNELAGIYRRLNMLDSALCYMRQMMAINRETGHTEDAAENIVISNIYRTVCMPDSAIHYAEKILNDPNAGLSQIANAHQNLYLLYEEQKRYKEAADHCFKFCLSLDSIYRMNQSRTLADIQAKYDYQDIIIEKDKIKVRGLLILSIVLCVAVLFIYLFQRKLRQKERILRKAQEEAHRKDVQIQSNESQIDYLKDCIAELNDRIEAGKRNWQHEVETLEKDRNQHCQYIANLETLRDNLSLKIDRLEKNNQALQQELEAQYTCSPQMTGDNQQEIEQLRKRYETLNRHLIQQTPILRALIDGSIKKLSPEEWENIKELLNLYYNQFAEKLKTTYHLKEADIELCCLLKLELPLTHIATYLHIGLDGVKKKKGRLKKDLEKKIGGWGTHSSFDSWLLGL